MSKCCCGNKALDGCNHCRECLEAVNLAVMATDINEQLKPDSNDTLSKPEPKTDLELVNKIWDKITFLSSTYGFKEFALDCVKEARREAEKDLLNRLARNLKEAFGVWDNYTLSIWKREVNKLRKELSQS